MNSTQDSCVTTRQLRLRLPPATAASEDPVPCDECHQQYGIHWIGYRWLCGPCSAEEFRLIQREVYGWR